MEMRVEVVKLKVAELYYIVLALEDENEDITDNGYLVNEEINKVFGSKFNYFDFAIARGGEVIDGEIWFNDIRQANKTATDLVEVIRLFNEKVNEIEKSDNQ